MEDYLDQIKTLIVGALVSSGLVDSDAAEEWCKNHTVILREKNTFRSIFSKWAKREPGAGHYVMVVKVIEQPEMKDVYSIDVEVPVELPPED